MCDVWEVKAEQNRELKVEASDGENQKFLEAGEKGEASEEESGRHWRTLEERDKIRCVSVGSSFGKQNERARQRANQGGNSGCELAAVFTDSQPDVPPLAEFQ